MKHFSRWVTIRFRVILNKCPYFTTEGWLLMHDSEQETKE